MRAKNDNKNVDIKFSLHDRLTLKVKRLENQILKMSGIKKKSKDLKKVVNVDKGHLCLREENLSFNNNYIIK
jgi:hypothetical protein